MTNFTAILNGEEHGIEIESVSPHIYRITVDGKPHSVDMRRCSSDAISILWDNRSYDISFSEEADTVELVFWNQRFSIQLLDERSLRMRQVRSQLDISGPEIIKTSMPGKIVKVLVDAGSTVEAGTPVIIIEAMKMENEIVCRQRGVVKSVNVADGQVVESDTVLLEITPD